MMGNNSCGVHSVMGGRTVDNIRELEVLTYDGLRMRVGPTSEDELQRIIAAGGRRGDIYSKLKALRDRWGDEVRRRYPKIPRRVSGFNLDELLPERGFNVARALVGTESTCVLVLEALTELMHNPPYRALVVIGYPDIFQCGDNVAAIRSYGPIGLEGLQKHLIDNIIGRASGPMALNSFPMATHGCWRSSAAIRKRKPSGAPTRRRTRSRHTSRDTLASRCWRSIIISGWYGASANRAWAPAAFRITKTPGRRGRTQKSRPRCSAIIFETSIKSSTSISTSGPFTDTSAMGASTPESRSG